MKSYQVDDEEKQFFLKKVHRVWCNGFFAKAQKYMFPEIHLTSESKPYRPFSDFIRCLRKMFSVVDIEGCRLEWRYESQINAHGWRKTSKKELGKRSGLTQNQVRECLRLAESKKFLERRYKGLGQGKGATLEIRIDFRRLEQNLMTAEEWNTIEIAPPTWRKKLSTDTNLDEGNFPRHYTKYKNNDNLDNERIEVFLEDSLIKIKTNPGGIGEPLKERQKDSNSFVVNEREMKMVEYLQSKDFDAGFPSPEFNWERIPVSWSCSLFTLFLKRVRQNGLSMRYLRSYQKEFETDHDRNLPPLFRLHFASFLKFFPKYKNYFLEQKFGEDLFSREVQADNFIRMANLSCLEFYTSGVRQLISRLTKNGADVSSIEGKIRFFKMHVREIPHLFRDFDWLAFFHFEPEFLGPELTEEAFRIHRQAEKESMIKYLPKMLCFHRLRPDFLKRLFQGYEEDLEKLLDYAEEIEKWAESIISRS